MKKIKVKFLQSPTGLYGLGYSPGDTAQVDEDLGEAMIENEYAVKVDEPKKSPPRKKQAVRKPDKDL